MIKKDFLQRVLSSNALLGVFIFVAALQPISLSAQTQQKPKSVSASGTVSKPKAKKAPAKIEKKVNPNIGARINSIDIEGLRKIEKDAVIAKLISKVGEPYSAENVSLDIQTLFRMNYFVQIEVLKNTGATGVDLTYKINEKPIVNEIIFEGNSDVKSDDLATQSGLKAFEVVNYDKVQEAAVKLQKYYEDKGFYLAKIKPEVEDVKKDESVRVKFVINENEKVKVKKITFVGNHKMSDNDLKNDPRFFTKEAGYFSFISSSGSYKQEAIDNDIQVIRYVYWNKGYLQVKVDRPTITVTPDKKSIYITYFIEEGEQYSVGEVDFAGDLLFPKSELYEASKIKDNGIFSVEVMRKDISELQAKYGDLGYAFANVIPRYNFREKERKVDLVYEFDKGQKVYFGEITVVGNTKTRDKVVRRELKIQEGELYNETRKRRSQENVQRLGFFDEVNFKTSTPPDKPNRLDIEIVVKERNTGQIQLTATYGNVQGFSLGGSIIQNNFNGLGQSLEARINAAKTRQDYLLSLTDPYFQDSLWSAGFDVFYIDDSERIAYDVRRFGGNVRFGHPIYEDYVRGYVRYKLEKASLFETDYTDPFLFPLDTARGVTSSVTLTVEYDTRNDRMFPSKGIFTDFSYERTGLGGNLRYQEFSSRFRFFFNPAWDLVWRNNLAYSNIQPLEQGGDVPFTELYQMGGAYSLRGFPLSSVGRRLYSPKQFDKYNTDPRYAGMTPEEKLRASYLVFGGTKQLLYQSELQFPLIKEAGLNWVFFFDVGQAQDDISADKFMSDAGMGFRWMSPLGLLRFEWGWPVKTDEYSPNAVNFEFSIGPPF